MVGEGRAGGTRLAQAGGEGCQWVGWGGRRSARYWWSGGSLAWKLVFRHSGGETRLIIQDVRSKVELILSLINVGM